MARRVLLLVALLAAARAPARDKPDDWIEVRSQHFVVATNSNEKQGRQIAEQFERMRAVCQRVLPTLQGDSSSPIVVLAVKDEKDFQALLPEDRLGTGQMNLVGLFLRAPDKNYVLLRLDAKGEHPYAVIYHEYTHLLLAKAAEWMPLWLEEGLAEFFQNTEIREKQALLGEGSPVNIMLLRQQKLLPLTTLFAVDQKSPYYHEEDKGSIFYAESWALTHFLELEDSQENKHRLNDYLELLSHHSDPVTAAGTAFGDLKQLEAALQKYIYRQPFLSFKTAGSTDVDDSAFTVQPLPPAQADALQADFLAYNGRTEDARAMLERVVEEDPNNVSAHETMGYLEFRQGHLEEARKWYAQAVQLDSQSFLAHYYFAAMSINNPGAASDEAQVEKSLRTAIKLNPSFAPAYDSLAIFLVTHHHDLNEAHTLGLTAVSLDPGNVGYRINVAHVLLALQQGQNAIQVLQAAAKLAKTPQEKQAVDDFLANAQAYVEARERSEEQRRLGEAADVTSSVTAVRASDADFPPPDHFVPSGPHRFFVGTLTNVRCERLEIDLTVDGATKSLALRAANYYKIQFTTLNFIPTGQLDPCKDLVGRSAKVEYVESADKSAAARVLGVELRK